MKLRRVLVNPPGDGVARIPAAPTRLRLLPAGRLTFRRVTGPLSDSYSRIRPEPPAADSAWSLPSLWHRDDSSSSSRADPVGGGQFRLIGSILGEHRRANLGERRSVQEHKMLIHAERTSTSRRFSPTSDAQ